MDYDYGHTPFAQVVVRVREGTRTTIGIVQAVMCDVIVVRFNGGLERVFPTSDVELVYH